MGNWDDLEAELHDIDLVRDAGEWAVIAMACVAFADGSADEDELAKAREIVSKVSVIKNSLGPEFGEQLYLDTIERIRSEPESELEHIKQELQEVAGRIADQSHRDQAFQTLVVIATADHTIDVAEHRMMQELKEIIGSEVMIPMPHIEV